MSNYNINAHDLDANKVVWLYCNDAQCAKNVAKILAENETRYKWVELRHADGELVWSR